MNHRTASPARTRMNRTPPLIVSGFLALAAVQSGGTVEVAAADYPATDVAAPLTPDQLDQLVAPIALYPDELVAEVLAAATYPTDVVEADRWIQTHAQLQGDALADAVNAQSWAGSVKALAQFPSVLAMMDKNLSWTTSLGGAYMRDSQSLMSAVQEMRARAEQAGNLKSSPQETVTNDEQTIDVEPTDAEVVYVPEYDPWFVYGVPIDFYPDWVPIPGLFVDEPGIFFGFGIGVSLFGDYGWGWNHWRPDWHRHGVFFNHRPYASHDLTFDQHRPDTLTRAGGFDRGGAFGGGFHAGEFAARGGAGIGGFRGAITEGFRGTSVGGFRGTSVGGFRGASGGGFRGASAGGSRGGGFHGGGFHGRGGGRR